MISIRKAKAKHISIIALNDKFDCNSFHLIGRVNNRVYFVLISVLKGRFCFVLLNE